MKLLLTSAGISNKSIQDAFVSLLDKPIGKTRVAFVPTAANIEEGDKGWLIEDLSNLQKLKLASLDIVDISALPRNIWQPRLKSADVLVFGGGNTFHLMHWMSKSGLQEILPNMLTNKLYVGISAGSCICGPTVFNSVQNLFGESYDLKIEKGLGLVDFHFIPYLNSGYFTKIREENLADAAKGIDEPIYALDDNSAIVVNGSEIRVVSEGVWYKFPKD